MEPAIETRAKEIGTEIFELLMTDHGASVLAEMDIQAALLL